jgi:hypothetical protein
VAGAAEPGYHFANNLSLLATDKSLDKYTGVNLKGASEKASIAGFGVGLLAAPGPTLAVTGEVVAIDQAYKLLDKDGRSMSQAFAEEKEGLAKDLTPLREPVQLLKAQGEDFSNRAKRRRNPNLPELAEDEIAQRVQTNPAATPTNLALPQVGNELTRQQRLEILNYGSTGQKMAMLMNDNAVSNMGDTERYVLSQADTSDEATSGVMRAYNDTLRRLSERRAAAAEDVPPPIL